MNRPMKTLIVALVVVVGGASVVSAFSGPIDHEWTALYATVENSSGYVLISDVGNDLPSGQGYTVLNFGGSQSLENVMVEAYGGAGPGVGDKVVVLGVTDPNWEWNMIATQGTLLYMIGLGGAASGDGLSYSVTDPDWEWN